MTEDHPYDVTYSRAARNDLAAKLPEKVVTAAIELITGDLRERPHRVGKPLHAPFDRRYVARRSTYRVIYRIDDETRTITIESVRQRGHAYRT